MTDYEFDMLQKEYDKLCDIYKIPLQNRITNFIGFDVLMPMLTHISI